MRSIMTFSLLLLGLVGAAFADSKENAPPPDKNQTIVVPFELVPSGHFIVKVKIDGKGPYNLIFDTGAPMMLVSPAIAKDSGLANKIKEKPPIALFGMMGFAKIDEFEVAGVKAKNVQTQIIDHPTVKLFSKEYEPKYGKIEGIVGFPFFSKFKMTVDYSKKEMTFTPSTFDPGDDNTIMTRMMEKMMSTKPEPKVVGASVLFGFEVGKDTKDETEGVEVKAVMPDTPAQKAGLKVGDRILTLGGRWTDSVGDLYSAASFAKPNKEIELGILRNGKNLKLKLTPVSGS